MYGLGEVQARGEKRAREKWRWGQQGPGRVNKQVAAASRESEEGAAGPPCHMSLEVKLDEDYKKTQGLSDEKVTQDHVSVR